MSVPEDNAAARSLAWRLFRDAADEDYLTARWAMRAGLKYQFAWSAQQSIEKYLKCSMLLNNQNVTKFGHDILKLFDGVKCLDHDLVPVLLCPPWYFPSSIHTHNGRFEPTRSFVERLAESGSTNNRYRYYSLTIAAFDLHKFDELCFQLRRITYPLDMNFDGTDKAFWEVLKRSPNFQPHARFSFMTATNKQGRDECEKNFAWRNFSYREDEAFDGRKIQGGMSSTNSEIYLASERGSGADEALEWILEKAWFSPSDKQDIRNIISGDLQS